MTSGERLRLALRYTFPSGRGHLTTFLSSLSILGLVLAIALLVVVLSVMNGFDKEMRERILALVPHISVYSHLPLEDYQGTVQQLRAHPEVVAVTPFAHFDALVMRGRDIETAQGIGLAAEADAGLETLLAMLEPSARDVFLQRQDALILGAALAQRLGVVAGDTVTLIVPGERKMNRSSSARFENVLLAGVINTGTELDQHVAVVPLPLASQLAGLGTGVSGFRVSTDNLFQVQRIAWELTASLPPGYYSTHWMMTHGNLYAAIQLSRDLVSILLFSIIAVAAFNVVSSLVLVVLDKRGNIAILRTLGASRGDVAWVFMLQGAMIGVVGVLIGGILGAVISFAVPHLVASLESLLGLQFLSTDVYPVSFLPVDVRVTDILWVGSIALAMCVLAAIYPARRAARLAPAVALNQEH